MSISKRLRSWFETKFRRPIRNRTTPRNKLRLAAESLEDRIAPAIVTTDLINYSPGGTAEINANGFMPGENVQFQVLHTDGTANTGANEAPWQVTDVSGLGNLETSWYLDPTDTGSFEVIAVGQTSGAVATTVFADSSLYSTPIVPATVSVATDQTNYGAGDTAVISSGTFQLGETVKYQVLRTDGGSNAPSDHAPWLVTDGSSGVPLPEMSADLTA
jgi:hypothetical protein